MNVEKAMKDLLEEQRTAGKLREELSEARLASQSKSDETNELEQALKQLKEERGNVEKLEECLKTQEQEKQALQQQLLKQPMAADNVEGNADLEEQLGKERVKSKILEEQLQEKMRVESTLKEEVERLQRAAKVHRDELQAILDDRLGKGTAAVQATTFTDDQRVETAKVPVGSAKNAIRARKEKKKRETPKSQDPAGTTSILSGVEEVELRLIHERDTMHAKRVARLKKSIGTERYEAYRKRMLDTSLFLRHYMDEGLRDNLKICGTLALSSEKEVLQCLDDYFDSLSGASASAYHKRRNAMELLVGHYIVGSGKISVKYFVHCIDKQYVAGMQ